MSSSETIAIPTQRVIQLPDSPTPFEQGRCADDLIHAARKTLNGYRALCDPTRPLALTTGRFDVDGKQSCAGCVALATPAR